MTLKVSIIGGGIAGLAAAIALTKVGCEVDVFEQAPENKRVGAAITMTPNAVRILDRLGVGPAVKAAAYVPQKRLNRVWDTGEITSVIELGEAAFARYGAPVWQLHRADLVEALVGALPADRLHFDERLTSFEVDSSGVKALFGDGTSVVSDVLIGADGIHSIVREALFGKERPRFTGAVGYRSIVPAHLLKHLDLSAFTKWFGPRPETEFLTTLTSSRGDFYIFASIYQPDWDEESWSTTGSIDELREAFRGYAQEVQEMLAVCTTTLKTAIYEREPLPEWTRGQVALVGDSCHPMMPFMAQGAAMGLEDAAVLGRCLDGVSKENLPSALKAFQRARQHRTAHIQNLSRRNKWPEPAEIDAIYCYDAWSAPLESAEFENSTSRE